MRRARHSSIAIRAVAVGLAAMACNSTNVIGPSNQVQVANLADNFQFQATALSNVSQSLTYSWTNTGDSASINQASSLTSGSAQLTIRGPTGTVLYQASLTNNGTFQSQKGTAGTWQIQVVLTKADGAVNFRAQKAP